MIETLDGDLLKASEDIICQQVNCRGVMGAGLALQIKKKYPKVYAEYKKICTDNLPISLLGQILIVDCDNGKYVANLFSQLSYGKNVQTDYNAFKSCLEKLCEVVISNEKFKNKILALPFGRGCGLAGGNWQIVYEIIENTTNKYSIDVMLYCMNT